MRSICQKLKSHWVLRLILQLGQLARWPVKCTNWWDFKCDSYTLHPYYIYSLYPQNYKEVIQKKALERFLQHTHHLRESYSSLSENSLVVSVDAWYCTHDLIKEDDWNDHPYAPKIMTALHVLIHSLHIIKMILRF